MEVNYPPFPATLRCFHTETNWDTWINWAGTAKSFYPRGDTTRKFLYCVTHLSFTLYNSSQIKQHKINEPNVDDSFDYSNSSSVSAMKVIPMDFEV